MDKFSAFLASPVNRPVVIIVLFVDLILRGLALYKSARQNQRYWFIALLVINSVGLLPLAYLLLDKWRSKKKKVND